MLRYALAALLTLVLLLLLLLCLSLCCDALYAVQLSVQDSAKSFLTELDMLNWGFSPVLLACSNVCDMVATVSIIFS
jgi:hypothetical protein